MKLKIALALFMAIGSLCAQAKFEKGYFITTNGNRINCLIKNEDWVNIPSEISYKLNPTDNKIKILNSKKAQKIVIFDKFIFERHNVKIDRYSNNNNLDSSRLLNYKEENLLLKVIVDSKVKLLKYSSKGANYFYTIKNDSLSPLEYKVYKLKNGSVGKNLNYKKQLREKFNCNNENFNRKKIKYNEKQLTDYFIKHNSCLLNGKEIKAYSKSLQKNEFNIRPKFSLNQTKLNNQKNKLILKYGVELEYVFPFNNKKWTVFTEPTYSSFSSSIENSKSIVHRTKMETVGGNIGYRTYYADYIEYKAIELPIGVRRYFFINEKNYLFLNTGFSVDIMLDSKLSNSQLAKDNIKHFIDIDSSYNFFFGLGYEFNKKISLEFRYDSNRPITNDEIKNISLKIGYNLF